MNEQSSNETNATNNENITNINDDNNSNDNDKIKLTPTCTNVNLPNANIKKQNTLAKIMNTLATRNCRSKPVFKETKFDQVAEEVSIIPDPKRSMESLQDKLSNSCDDLLECSYGEFEKDLRNDYNFVSPSVSFAQFNESNVSLSEVNDTVRLFNRD